jgi:hypothetical protein
MYESYVNTAQLAVGVTVHLQARGGLSALDAQLRVLRVGGSVPRWWWLGWCTTCDLSLGCGALALAPF